jgi:hypothetical protein
MNKTTTYKVVFNIRSAWKYELCRFKTFIPHSLNPFEAASNACAVQAIFYSLHEKLVQNIKACSIVHF